MKSVMLAVLVFANYAMAESGLMDVNHLNQSLRQTKAGWVAKPNHLTQLSVSQLKAMMGVKRSAETHFHLNPPATKPNAALPAVVDWRANNGNWVTPVLDQGYCGSCVAFASIGTLETQYRISTGLSTFNIKLSPQYILDCGGGSCGMGWEPTDAANFLQSTGATAESCLPYTSGETDQDVACSAACPTAGQDNVKIAAFSQPTRLGFDIDALKAALQKGPLVTTLDVYADFMLYSSGVYKHVSGDVLGGHAISIVGYDDNQQALIIRNSWGSDWGMEGFAYVSYSDVSGVGSETWAFTMPSSAGAVSVASPLDYAHFSGTANVQATSTYVNTDSLSVSFFNAGGTAVWTNNCTGSTCNLNADVSGLPDGNYTVQAIALDSTGKQLTRSVVQSFYVSNTQPALTVNFSGTKSTDLSKPLTGVIVMSIAVNSANGVPLTSVVFHHKSVSIGQEVTREATAVADGMLMDWGTENVTNGSYEIWFEGHLTTNTFDDVVSSPHLTVQTQN